MRERSAGGKQFTKFLLLACFSVLKYMATKTQRSGAADDFLKGATSMNSIQNNLMNWWWRDANTVGRL